MLRLARGIKALAQKTNRSGTKPFPPRPYPGFETLFLQPGAVQQVALIERQRTVPVFVDL